jgi:WD40 repeat protein
MAYRYTFGGTLFPDDCSYVTRKADRDLYEALTAGKFCYVLNSRQTGKSSLRIRTEIQLNAIGTSCGVLDFSVRSKTDQPEQWYADTFYELVSEFNLEVDLTWWTKHKLFSPVKRLSNFIEEVLLTSVPGNIVLFVDEIDSVLSLPFRADDFFALIRACYNRRADNSEYHRLTFALLGVANPSDLIQDKEFTPFNIGQAIQLEGFQFEEAKPLAQGLVEKASNPEAILKQVLEWTNGQPFLTQRLCALIQASEVFIPEDLEVEQVQEIVRSLVIEGWESKDEPEHLRTIGNRLTAKQHLTLATLSIYQKILNKEEVVFDRSPEKMELILSGIVTQQGENLKVRNRIYESIFNHVWVEQLLGDRRPYASRLLQWQSSNCQDNSFLLRGEELQQIMRWAEGKLLGSQDFEFIKESQKLEGLKFKRNLEEARTQLNEAQKKRRQQIRRGKFILSLSLIGSAALIMGAILLSVNASLKNQQYKLKYLNSQAQDLLFSNQWAEAMRASLQAEQLRNAIAIQVPELGVNIPWVPNNLKSETINTLKQVAQTIILDGDKGVLYSVDFSPNGRTIATASKDGIVKLWSWHHKPGHLIKTLDGPNGKVFSVSFSPDSKLLASLSCDKSDSTSNFYGCRKIIRLWNLNNYKVVNEWYSGHAKNVTDISFSPDGRTIAATTDDQTVSLWNLKGTLLHTLKGHTDKINAVRFSPDDRTIATASNDHTVKLWSPEGVLLHTLTGHTKKVTSVSFDRDSQTIATTSFDQTIKLWGVDGELKSTHFLNQNDWVWAANFTTGPDGKVKLWANAKGDNYVRIWPISFGEQQPLQDNEERSLKVLLLEGCHRLASLYTDNSFKDYQSSNLSSDSEPIRSCQE